MTRPDRILPGSAPRAMLDADCFARVTGIARTAAGLSIPESKKTMVQSRLARRLRATGIAGFPAYLDHVEGPDGAAERDLMIASLTTNVSHFFREEHHFETLRTMILPPLLERARGGGRVRIWSAGCSTGQEPCTIAMILAEAEPGIDALDVRILATDIDASVLAKASAGRYDTREAASIPPTFRNRYFASTQRDGLPAIETGPQIRRLVRYRLLNLTADWPMRGRFDAIFCRNVVIYFSDDTRARLWPRFRDALTPDGWLFIGHSERMQDPDVHGFSAAGVTTYRRLQGAGARQPTQEERWH